MLLNIRNLCYFILFFFIPFYLSAAVDSGDLLNSVKRSQIITHVFLDRWDVVYNSRSIKELDHLDLKERFYHVYRGGYADNLDLYFSYENIQNIPVSTAFGNYDLDLFRIAFSAIVKFDDLIDFGNGISWGFAVGAVGYRYGMYAESTMSNNGASFIPSGTSTTQSFKTTDYIYSQTYDDLIVLTNILKPFGYFHIGLLFNQQINPGLDGIIGSDDDEKEKDNSRLFVNSNLFGSLTINLTFNSEEEAAESFDFSIDIFGLTGIFGWTKKRYLYPDLYLGYQYTSKAGVREKNVRTLFLEFDYNIYNAMYFKGKAETFLSGREGLERDRFFKQAYGEIGFRLFMSEILFNPVSYYGQYKVVPKPVYIKDENGKIVKKTKPPKYYYRKRQRLYRTYYFILGLSYLADKRLLSYDSDKVDTIGYSAGLKIVYAGWLGGLTAEARASRNYSPKIYNLIEAYNSWIFEISATLGF